MSAKSPKDRRVKAIPNSYHECMDVAGRTERLRAARFNTTHWSVVLACSGENGTLDTRAAQTILFQTYWYPLYAYVRRRGYGEQDAEDLCRDFAPIFNKSTRSPKPIGSEGSSVPSC